MAEIRHGNFSTCCRLCLSEGADILKPVFNGSDDENNTSQEIQSFLTIEIRLSDKISTMVCDRCIEKLNGWKSFKQLCVQNQTILGNWLKDWSNSNQNISSLSMQIKEEVIEEEGNHTDEEIEVMNGEVETRIKAEPLDEFVEMPALTPQREELDHSDAPQNESTSSERIDEDTSTSFNAETGSNLKDNEKIEFAAGLKLFEKDSPPISTENLSKIELSYIEKCKAMITMFRTNVCACHNVFHQSSKGLLSHLRALKIWFPVFTCFNCMITTTDRSSSKKHQVRCPNGPQQGLIRLSNLRKRTEMKTRLYQNYKCFKCKFMFSFHEDFCTHIDEYHAEESSPYLCFCQKTFETVEDYKQHLYGSCMILFYCDICFITTTSIEDFIKHAEQVHDNSEGFILQQDDNYKKRVIHKIEDKIEDKVELVDGERKRRSTYSRSSASEAETPPPSKLMRLNEPPCQGFTKDPHTCPICNKLYSSYPNMIRHYRTHTEVNGFLEQSPIDNSMYCCPDCGVMCNSQEWDIHKKSHGTKKCNECNKEFQFQSELEQHRSVHLNLKVYRDSKTKSYKSSLLSPNSEESSGIFDEVADNVQIKSEPVGDDEILSSNYACGPCNKSYVGYSGLWEHNKKKHSNSKPITSPYPKQCPHCPKICTTGASFYRHSQLHKNLISTKNDNPQHSEDTDNLLEPETIIEERPKSRKSGVQGESEDYHTCKCCFKVFSNRSNLRNHMKLHGYSLKNTGKNKGLKKLTCEICYTAFGSSEQLDVHMEEEHNEMPKLASIVESFNKPVTPFLFTCDVCVQTFTTKEALRKHKDKHLLETGPSSSNKCRPYCKHCKIMFSSEDLLGEHMQKEHDEHLSKATQKSQQFACKICRKVFQSSSALHAHQGWHKRAKFDKGRNQDSIKNVVSMAPKPVTVKSEHHCYTCSTDLPNATALQIHMLERHSNFNPYAVPRCDSCDQDFDTKDEYDNHKRLHELIEKQNQGKLEQNNSNQPAHQTKALKPYPCKYCKSAFSRIDTLTAHVRQNHPDNIGVTFRCNQCDRVFDKQGSLNIHLKAHEKQKAVINGNTSTPTNKSLYNCSICNMGFNLPKDLRVHTISAHPF